MSWFRCVPRTIHELRSDCVFERLIVGWNILELQLAAAHASGVAASESPARLRSRTYLLICVTRQLTLENVLVLSGFFPLKVLTKYTRLLV